MVLYVEFGIVASLLLAISVAHKGINLFFVQTEIRVVCAIRRAILLAIALIPGTLMLALRPRALSCLKLLTQWPLWFLCLGPLRWPPVGSDFSSQAQGCTDPASSSSVAPVPPNSVVSPQAQVPGPSDPPSSSLGAPSVVVSVLDGTGAADAPQPSEQRDDVFVDASDGSDIDEFPDTS